MLKFFLYSLFLATIPAMVEAKPTTVPVPPPSATNLWFEVGEELRYNIYWGMIHVGQSVVTTDWVVHDDGRTLLRIRFRTRTNRVVEKLYPVSDLQEALIDPDTFLPVQFMKDSRQGRHTQHEITRFYHSTGKAEWESLTKKKTMELDIQPDTRDLITLMYFMRSLDFEVGATKELQVYTDEKIYDLSLRLPRKERVELQKYGPVTSFLIDPEAAFNGLFVRKGKMNLWVSDDDRKICTKITATVPVASIRIQLADVKGPGEDFWVGRSAEGSPESTPIPRSR
ncbi:MAG TPA: DUF3108 domain-containing protein [Kiritimatiellia bacterium]|nr:DUF3108 domain-containing protein [Kiritimatiellia bacterium]